MTNTRRDNFSKPVVRALRERVNNLCSNPDCGKQTIEPQKATLDKINLTGTAAHICAASVGGPRYDETMSQQERKSIENGIWLCNHCARKIDIEPDAYSVELLKEWKNKAELKLLANSNSPLYAESEFQKEAQLRVLESHRSGQSFIGVANSSLNTISKIVQEELRILDPRLNISCDYINSTTHYRIDVAEDSEESVKINFKPNSAEEFTKKYTKLIEGGETFEIDVDAISSNSEALNVIFPSQIKDGKLYVKKNSDLRGELEFFDEKENLILSGNSEVVYGEKSHSLEITKFDGLMTIKYKNSPIKIGEPNKIHFEISIHLKNWDDIPVERLTYFNQIKRVYKLLAECNQLKVRLSVNRIEISSVITENFQKDWINSMYILLEYVENARKISEKLKVDVLFRSDFPLNNTEINNSYEIVELLANKSHEKKFSAFSNFIPNNEKQELDAIFAQEDYEIIILENRKLSNFILLDTKVKSTKIYIKTTIINPLFEVVEKTKNKEGRIEYKCKVLPKDETSYLNREVSLEPFNLQKN